MKVGNVKVGDVLYNGKSYIVREDYSLEDLEPHEEPIKFSISAEGMDGKNLTPKDILDIFRKKGLTFVNTEDNAPITQEFIESFGFKYCASARERFVILYELRYNYTHGFSCFDSLFLEECNGRFSMYYGFQIGKQQYEYIFRDYTCTTQSELRFLLTKGRIDCSK